MFPWARVQGLSVRPSDRFSTTYNTDFKPLCKRKADLKPRAEAKPGFNMSLQPERKTTPVLFQHLYLKTNNNILDVGSQKTSGSLFPAFTPSLGGSHSSVSEETKNAGYQGKDVAPREPGTRTGVSVGATAEAPWQNVCANALNRQRDDLKWMKDVHYQEGVIFFSPYKGPVSCEEFLRFLHTGARPSHPLTLPGALCPYDSPSQNPGTWQSCWSSVSPAAKPPQNNAFLHSTQSSAQCGHCGWEPQHPSSYFCGAPAASPHTCQRAAKPASDRTQPGRTPLQLTEYQARYSAQWSQPRNRLPEHPPPPPPQYTTSFI